tara:strand:- start:2096 stop:2230 length:135 start_codon:yes stop_codon:yes gene_type:complete
MNKAENEIDKNVMKNFFLETLGLYKNIENRSIIRQRIIKKRENI